MGVLNVTPDSFSDGGDFFSPAQALTQAEQMMAQGADFLDVGAESSAPNSPEVSLDEEWRRLKDILPELARRHIPFSVDTWKSAIAQRALDLGAEMINDVTGLRGDPEMAAVIAAFPEACVCIMYSKDTSARTTMQDFQEEDIIQKISLFFEERLQYAQKIGIRKEKILLDPGMGAFLSSNPEKSFEVLQRLQGFQKFDCSLLIGTSRKGFLKTVSDQKNHKNRVIASIVSALVAIQNGARIVRVHDVKETREALNVWQKVR